MRASIWRPRGGTRDGDFPGLCSLKLSHGLEASRINKSFEVTAPRTKSQGEGETGLQSIPFEDWTPIVVYRPSRVE